MADNRTMVQLLEAPTEGYEDTIVVPEITANNFEIKHGLLNLVQNKQFFGHDKEDPHAHIRYFNKITSTMKFPNVPKLHQLDTFYNSLNSNDQDSLNSAAVVTFWNKMPPRMPKNHREKSKFVNHDARPLFLKDGIMTRVEKKDTVQPSTENIQPPVVQTDDQIGEPVVASKTKPTLPYPSRDNKEKLREKDDLLASKFMSIFGIPFSTLKKFADALLHMPKFAPMFRKLLNDKDKIIKLTKTQHQPNASLHLERTKSPALTKTRMILELADRTISTPTGIAEDIFVKVGTFFFPADFMVVDYVADPRVPLILGRPFLRTARALIDVHGEQMTLRHDDQSVTFKVGDTKTFSYNIIESVNRVDVIDIACEEYVQEVLEISESGNPTSTSDLMIDSRSPSFTPFGGSDFLMEEIDEFLEHDDSIPPGVDGIYDSEGDIVYLEELLSVINSDPNLPPSPVCEINVPEKIKSSCEDPPDLELKDLPSHLEYAFLEGDDKLPVIIAKNLKDEDKTALIKVLKSHKLP
ncbi:reverse transcriptase domain-containing protein [Tanacetum coccineum]